MQMLSNQAQKCLKDFGRRALFTILNHHKAVRITALSTLVQLIRIIKGMKAGDDKEQDEEQKERQAGWD